LADVDDEHHLLMGDGRREMNAFVFVYRGEGRFGKSHQPGKSGQALILDTTGAASFTAVANTESNLKFLLLAGQPINEPIARFVHDHTRTHARTQRAD
jgi:redox-sensitive bicupin YhaK (pirin superfamily)